MSFVYLTIAAVAILFALYMAYRGRESAEALDAAKSKLASQEQLIQSLQANLSEQQQETAKSNTLYATISNVSYDHVLVFDESKALIAHNQSAKSLFGDKNPIGEQLHAFLDAPDLADIISHASEESETLEEQFVIDKRYFRARTQVVPHEEGKFFIGVAIQDITQLVRLNRARRDMVANISHELRTPITKIRFVIDSLFYDADKPKRKASIDSLHEISTEVGELEDVVQELLDLSMIESGQSIMKLVDEPLHEIVDAAVERLSEKLENKEITVVSHIPDKMRVLCDREHIRRIFTNLISNALKWSPPKDVVTVSATISGEDITVSVYDNGPGVPDDQRERIFERFYQVDTARSGREGSGLGLAICKHIVEAHGGKIWAEGNSQGNGGRFMFTLLNALPGQQNDAYMDKAQHDFVFNPVTDGNSDASVNES